MKNTLLEKLIQDLKTIPMISQKQAERLAFYFVQEDKDKIDRILNSIKEANDLVVYCQECFILTDQKICYICSDKNREKVLVVVENSSDVFKLEKTQNIKSYYHVLNGLIKVNQQNKFPNLDLEKFKERVNKYSEIIIALSPNLEGLITANFLKTILKDKKVTQLAIGIPLGAAMEYVDDISLKNAFENRKEIK